MSSLLPTDLDVDAQVLYSTGLHFTSREEGRIDFCGARELPVMPQHGSLSPE